MNTGQDKGEESEFAEWGSQNTSVASHVCLDGKDGRRNENPKEPKRVRVENFGKN